MTEAIDAGFNVLPGTYACTNCGAEVDVDTSGHLPACPSCDHDQYDTAPEMIPTTAS
jgi:Zn finger protein HypA/HybF involved in hydrogenase expression